MARIICKQLPRAAKEVIGWMIVAASLTCSPVTQAHAQPSMAAAATSSKEQCAELAAKSVSLRAEMKRLGGASIARSDQLAEVHKVTSATAVAGQVIAPYTGLIGHAVTEGALNAQRAADSNAISAVLGTTARMTVMSQEIQQIELQRRTQCARESK